MHEPEKEIISAGIAMAVATVVVAPAAVAAERPDDRFDRLLEAAPAVDRVLTDMATDNANGANATITKGALSFENSAGPWMKIHLPESAAHVDDTRVAIGSSPLVATELMQAEAMPAARSTGSASAPTQNSASARAVVAVPDANSPDAYEFELEMPEGMVATLEDDGSVSIELDPELGSSIDGVTAEATFGVIKAPWAQDAAGNALETSFTLEGNTLTQHIDLDAAEQFPVIADPEAEWMGWFGRLTYSAAETAEMRDQGVVVGGLLAASAGIAALFGPGAPIVGAALAAAGAGAVGIIATTASNAHSDGRCLQVDIPPLVNPDIVDCRS
ncbi:MAG: hypothetical protein K0R99_2887 [Microbacterium sp.]|jgi:hypothetical protein|uniref:hypothetical protein n=1 Tax=Microbacterium sp. TaxID=51671 RepID=UPI00263A05A1|nr:hypothetical protein [Microbacterium sp.]MDF2561441.1 hypothetical protein [Microbacterium sp.]